MPHPFSFPDPTGGAGTHRRDFLRCGAGAMASLAWPTTAWPAALDPQARRPRLAVLLTAYGALSHGVCYCTKFLEGKQFDDHFEPPRCDVAAIHLMEIARNDVGIATAKRHGVPLFPSVATALCRGGDELAVD